MYRYTNSRGTEYFLHNKGTLHYFSKSKDGSIEMPQGYAVVESEKTGLPFLKKK
jgi:hypothetical protein